MPTSPLESQIRGLYNDTERGIKGKLSSDDITKKEMEYVAKSINNIFH
jgi:hypothetical protein